MSESAGTPERRLFFLSRSGADVDVARAVDRILREAGQQTVLQDGAFTHQDFMAAMERAFATGDEGAVMVAFLSAGYRDSAECGTELQQTLGHFPESAQGHLMAFRIGDFAVDGMATPLEFVDLLPVLSIEDDLRRGEVFAETVLGALGLSRSGEHLVYLRNADGSAVTPEGLSAIALAEQSGRADIDLGGFARLAKAVAHEPLALRLAARLLAERSGAGVKTFLEALAEHRASMLTRTAYPPELRAALLTSFEVVEGDVSMQGQSATSLLALAAVMPGARVPPAAFRRPLERYPPELAPFAADPSLRERALDLLDRLGLVTRAGSAGSYSIELPFQAILRDLLAESAKAEEWAEAAVRLSVDGAASGPAGVAQVQPSTAGQAPSAARVPDASVGVVAPAARPSGPPSRDAAFAAFEEGESLASDGKAGEALKAFETARAIFQDLTDASPDDTQAQADLAASHAKIGLTYIGAGHVGEGERWLKSCRGLIVRLARREPKNELWPRYLDSLDAQMAEIGRAKAPPSTPAKPAATANASSIETGGDTVRRLVNALKEPAPDPLAPPSEPSPAEEPLPLVIEADRPPPKVFSDAGNEPVVLEQETVFVKSKRRILPLAVNGYGHDVPDGSESPPSDSLGPAPDPLTPHATRKAGFLARLFGRRS